MEGEPKSSSARRRLFPSDDDAPTPAPPASPPSAPMMLPQSQSASNSTNLACPRLKNYTPAQEMDEGGKPSQQPRRIGNSSSTNEGVQEVEEKKASANDRVEEVEEEEKTSANDGVQEEKVEALKIDLPSSGLESTPLDVAAGYKKKATAKGKRAAAAKGKRAAVRVWSVEDEVRILKCLAAFVKENGAPPRRSELCEVVHGHVVDKKEFSVIQIYEKVRQLRNKYYSMRTKAAAGAPPPGDAEDLRKYELSREIWEGDALLLPKREIEDNSSSGQARVRVRVRREFEELQGMYPHLALMVEEIAAGGNRGFLKRAFQLIDDGTALKLDAKLKKQRVLEMKMQQDRTSARSEVLHMFVE